MNEENDQIPEWRESGNAEQTTSSKTDEDSTFVINNQQKLGNLIGNIIVDGVMVNRAGLKGLGNDSSKSSILDQ